ncbi:MAG: glycogen synthase [Spartobacteria bacterium]|nr:glycogen synthase [Spartobacteria bacterium]
MKAMLLTNEFPPNIYGGAGVHVDYLSRELKKIIDVDVRCFGDQSVDEPHFSVRGAEPEAYLASDAKLKSVFKALDCGIKFNAYPVDSDIVHCHTWYSDFGGILASQAYGIPLVVTTHSLEPSRPWKREQLGRGYDVSCWVEKTAMEMADGIIAVSNGMKEDVQRFFNVDADRIRVIYNGIDTDEYVPSKTKDCFEKYGINPDMPFVLFVGRITRQKGIIHLVNAIKHLDDNIQVVLCAGAPDTKEIADEMKLGVQQAQQSRDNIIWIQEMVDKKTVRELYSHAAVFCCPSIYEPFGIINLEAMACETPVVASAVGGITEVVVPGETGLLIPVDQFTESPFEPRDPEGFARDLAHGINQIMRDPALQTAMGKAGRQRAVDVFSWKSIAAQTAAFYEELIAAKKGHE